MTSAEPSPTPAADLPEVLERRVLVCLRDHPHDNTARLLAELLQVADLEPVDRALDALETRSLVLSAGAHWALTRRGWTAARAADEP